MKVALTKKNVQRMLKHLPTQLKAEQLGCGIKMHPDTPARVMRAMNSAMRRRKGVRVHILPSDVQAGSGFWDWLKSAATTVWEKGLKPMASAVGQIAKPIYNVAKPLIRPALKAALPAIGTALGGPVGTALGSTLAPQVLDVVGDTTKAFGMKRGGAVKRKPAVMSRPSMGLQDNYSTLMSPNHPIFHTNFQLPDHSMAPVLRLASTGSVAGRGILIPKSSEYLAFDPVLAKPDYTRGGSYLPAGYRARGGKIVPKVGGSFRSSGY